MRAQVVVVGTGAAGVSAAWPLARAGLDVLMIDPGLDMPTPELPNIDYLHARRTDDAQSKWMFAHRLSNLTADSPKFRVPTLANVFSGFAELQKIHTENFTAIGSIACGGLTTAWGAGVAAFSESEMRDWPLPRSALDVHYRSISRRIGISGGSEDDLSEHFGIEGEAELPLDAVGQYIDGRYHSARARLSQRDFRLAHARLAVLTKDRGSRRACAQFGLCLWGCPRGSIYKASDDLKDLLKTGNLRHRSGIFAETFRRDGEAYVIRFLDRRNGQRGEIRANRILLAAGTLGSAKLALDHLGHIDKPIRFQSTPTAAFALLFPRLIGRPPSGGTGLAQHWYQLGNDADAVCGGLFPTTGLPISEFVLRAPFARRLGIVVLSRLLPAMRVGNVFFDGARSDHRLTLRSDGSLFIQGNLAEGFALHAKSTERKLRTAFRLIGGLAIPGSFKAGALGSDVHYAGTIPMRARPQPGETSADGGLWGAPGVFVVDGSVLPSLPPKSHTLTIMANAERIGCGVVQQLSASR